MKKLLMILLVLLMGGTSIATVTLAQEVKREITRVTFDIYRFQNRFHNNMIVITGDGVVVTDPINAEAASWLRAEIAKLTDEPITHLIYSHSHGDHASGGTEYGDVPNVIMQQNAPEDIDLVEATERFSDELSFTVGSKTFELTYLGPGHGTDMIAMVVQPEAVAFVVDVVSAKRLFYRDFPGADVDQWIQQVKKVEALDFDILIGGHGPVGTKKDVSAGIAYLEELRAAVLEGLKAGQSVDELKQTVLMEKYKTWGSYDQWRELNVQGMARHLVESGTVK
ncbi:MAG: MBL fold metallo-hydrolase [Gammaproteobacteria bacterium]|nr:MBL fold metallo-hydrolase [Gammaproteobacteria bacterium]